MNTSPREFCTYVYLDESRRPYYIGKGRIDRPFSRHLNVIVPSSDNILILKKNLTEAEALNHEEYMISVLGRKIDGSGILENKLQRGPQTAIFYPKADPSEWASDLLCSVFGNRTAACVLLFLQQEGEAHALRIAKTFGFGLNQTQRQLRRLEDSCVLTSRKVGTVRLYAFNHRNPTVRNLLEFLEAENAGVVSGIRVNGVYQESA